MEEESETEMRLDLQVLQMERCVWISQGAHQLKLAVGKGNDYISKLAMYNYNFTH